LVNGLGLAADGTVLMSLRTTSGIIGVDKASGSVKLHIPPSVVSHQHAPVPLANGHVLTFDNGNFRQGAHVAFSRVLEIDPVSTRSHGATRTRWSTPSTPPSWAARSGCGTATRTSRSPPPGACLRVTPQGEVVWEFILPWFGEYPDAAARRTGPGRLNTVFQTWRYQAEQLPWLSR
jgi:hypothetical protein